MGYTIKIGNAVPKFSKEHGELYAAWEVELMKQDNAPAFGELTDFENQRWPSYTAWANSMHVLGLYNLFFNQNNGLMSQHPGCKSITAKHVAQIKEAIALRRLIKGGNPPGFCDCDSDPHLARGIWLEYWMAWAVENCETPAIENS